VVVELLLTSALHSTQAGLPCQARFPGLQGPVSAVPPDWRPRWMVL